MLQEETQDPWISILWINQRNRDGGAFYNIVGPCSVMLTLNLRSIG